MLTRFFSACAVCLRCCTYAAVMFLRIKSTVNARLTIIDSSLQKVSWFVKDKDDVPKRPWDLCITCGRFAVRAVSHQTIAMIPESSCIVRSRLG